MADLQSKVLPAPALGPDLDALSEWFIEAMGRTTLGCAPRPVRAEVTVRVVIAILRCDDNGLDLIFFFNAP